MPICPNGHQSGTDDWCEVCGMRISASGPGSGPASPPLSSAMPSAPASSPSAPVSSPLSSSPSAPPSSPPPPGFGTGFGAGAGAGIGAGFGAGYDGGETAAAEACPQCGTPREGQALFCEECRYNFGTRAPSPPLPGPVVVPPGPVAVPPAAAASPGPPQPTVPGYPPYQRHESERSRPSQVNRPAEPVPSESLTLASGSGDFLLEPPSTSVRRDPASSTDTSVTPKPASVPTVVPSQPVPAEAVATAWVAVVGADREYFAAMMARSGPEAQGLYFPAYSPEVRLPLTGNQITVGRRRQSTGEVPDIDLSRAPEDPGVSHQHAVLVQQPDGSWSVVDQDSTNGTTVNLGEEPIRPYTPVPLGEGDRVHVGAWTTITVRRG